MMAGTQRKNSIQWNGGIESAHQVYAFIGKPFEPIWAYQTLVGGQPVFDPMMGSPILHIAAREGDIWMQPGDWLFKDAEDFKIIRGGVAAL